MNKDNYIEDRNTIYNREPDIEVTFGQVLLEQIKVVQVSTNIDNLNLLQQSVESFESLLSPYLPQEYYTNKQEQLSRDFLFLMRAKRDHNQDKIVYLSRKISLTIFRLLLFYCKALKLIPSKNPESASFTNIYRGDNNETEK